MTLFSCFFTVFQFHDFVCFFVYLHHLSCTETVSFVGGRRLTNKLKLAALYKGSLSHVFLSLKLLTRLLLFSHVSV